MVAEAIARIEEGIDALAVLAEADLASEDTVIELHRLRNRLESVLATSTAGFDASGEWRASRCRSAAHLIAWRCHEPVNAAKATVRLGRSLRNMERVAEAWAHGEINRHHVALLSKARTDATAEAFDRDGKALVDDAMHMAYSEFKRSLDYWCWTQDPDGADRSYKDKEEDRRLHMSRSFFDMWVGDFLLDPVRGEIVGNELRRIEQALFEADWAEARDRLGDDATILDLRRSPAQRRADALVEMAIRSGTAPADGRRPEPLFSVFVNYETICELARGTIVPPGALFPWLDQAWIERVVFDSPSRVIDVGVERRIFTGATKRAVQLRDRKCYHPSCDLPAEDCQIDHVIPWSKDGPTVQDNGRPACGFHNRARNGDDEDDRGPPDDPSP